MNLLQTIFTGIPCSSDRNSGESRMVEIELTRILFKHGVRANVIVLLSVFCIVWLFRDFVRFTFLLYWGIITALVAVGRLYLIRGYATCKPTFAENRKYLYWYQLSIVCITLCWSALINVGIRLPEFEYRVFFLMLLLAILGAAAASLTSNLTALYVYILAPSIPIVPVLLLSGQQKDVAMGVVLICFVSLLAKMGHDVFNVLKSFVELRFQLEKTRDSLEEKVVERTKDLKESRDIAEKANTAKSVFLAKMSHEIRTPMNAIINLSQLALQEEMSDKARDFITKVFGSGNSLLGIINDILDISKIEAGKFNIENISFDLKKLITEATAVHESSAKEKELGYTVDFAPELDRYYIGDPLRLRQVLNNLIGNSIKFTHQGRIDVQVLCIENGEDSATIELRVADTGIGISEAQRSKLFQQFQQADDSTTRKYGGTGLGLVISMQLVRLMGGALTVDSEYGVGSTFSVRLSLPHAEPILPDLEEEPETFDLHLLAPCAGAEILVVDDIIPNQIIMTSILEKIDIKAICAANGRDALHQLENRDFDLVFLDVEMPEMDGYEAAKHIRSNPKWSSLPVIAMTANVMPEDVRKCLDAGMDHCLLKPLDLQDVYRVLEKFLLSGEHKP